MLCAVSLQMEFRIKTYKGREGDDGRWKIGKNGRTREREREGEEEIVFREKLFEMTIAIFF